MKHRRQDILMEESFGRFREEFIRIIKGTKHDDNTTDIMHKYHIAQ